MLYVAAVKLVAILSAIVASVRAGFWLGIGCLVLMGYVVVALTAASLGYGLPLGQTLWEHWWLTIVVIPALSFAGMVLARRGRDAVDRDDPRHEHLDHAMMAFLANGLLDTALMVLVFAGMLLWSEY